MTIRNLDRLFAPRSIALIGASGRAHSVGQVMARNLFRGGFSGPIMPVNPHQHAVEGVLCYPDVESLPEAPDLAVIATPPAQIPALIGALGARGCRAAIVVTAGFGEGEDRAGKALAQQMLDAARPYLLRILGPNCIGLAVPAAGLNATFAHLEPLAGDVACLTQSGAVAAALLDWAAARGIGFSHLVSLGDMADVDFGDLLDYLALSPKVRAILLYVEGVTHARKFISAARAAARAKPVIVIKAGRFAQSAKAASSHTGALAGADPVYDAAFRRAGMLRVFNLDELFDALETLSRSGPITGDRLAILTNGGGVGVLATDALIQAGGRLAAIDEATLSALSEVLPKTWSHGNPIDIIGDADGQRYARALELLLVAPDLDAVLVLNCPTAIASSLEAAEAVVETVRRITSVRRVVPVLSSWLGGAKAAEGRARLAAAKIPSYHTPEAAIGAFMHMVEFRRNQALLLEAPPAVTGLFEADREQARVVLEAARAEGAEWLDEFSAKRVLAAYGIPVGEIRKVARVEDAVAAQRAIAKPVVLKIVSPDILHKSDVGGVRLDLSRPEDVEAAAQAMIAAIQEKRPGARIEGFVVEEMIRKPNGIELILGVSADATFGPVILFGAGGVAVEVIRDTAMALPPLNLNLAHDLMRRTRIFRRLQGYRATPAADLDAIAVTLVKLSQLVADWPMITELDINPLIADAAGVVALDARIRVDFTTPRAQFAIMPYPSDQEQLLHPRDDFGVAVRPIRPEDAALIRNTFHKIDPADIRMRFLSAMREMPAHLLARLTQIDYDREMAWLALPSDPNAPPEMYGVVRLNADPDKQRAEYAILVRSDLKGHGLGYAMMQMMLAYARGQGIGEVYGVILRENHAMIELVKHIGFEVAPDPEDASLVIATIALQAL